MVVENHYEHIPARTQEHTERWHINFLLHALCFLVEVLGLV